MRAVLCWLQVEVCNSRMGQDHTYTGPAYANGTIVLTAQQIAGSECLPEQAVEAPCVTGCALNVSYAVLGCARAIPCTRPAQYTPGQDPRALSRCTALATPHLVHAPASHDSSAGTYPGVQAQQMLSTCLEASQNKLPPFGRDASPAQCLRLTDMTAHEVPLMGALCSSWSGYACTSVILNLWHMQILGCCAGFARGCFYGMSTPAAQP